MVRYEVGNLVGFVFRFSCGAFLGQLDICCKRYGLFVRLGIKVSSNHFFLKKYYL